MATTGASAEGHFDPPSWEAVIRSEWGSINPPLFAEADLVPTTMTPQEAWALLTSLPTAARQLLAQMISVYLSLEEVPPLSFRREEASAALPLLAARLVKPTWEEDQHLYDDEWGAVPPGLLAVMPEFRLNALVLAILSGRPQDGELVYDQMRAHDASWRVFSSTSSAAGQ